MLFWGYSAEEKLAVWSWPVSSGCVEWVAGTDGHGYGMMCVAGLRCAAHRTAYELSKGPIPPKFEVDHLCRNPLCVNPAHLEAVPKRVNILRGFGPPAQHARKTHCKHGHPFAGENLLVRNGVRICLQCQRERPRRMTRSSLRRRPKDGAPGLGWRADLTHCANGHPFDEANTYRPSAGRRQCRACNRLAARNYKARRP